MKRLYLIRHAKSSWNSPELSDHDRPLNERGNADAPEMAERLALQPLANPHVLISSAKRTQETWQHIAAATGIEEKNTTVLEQLYLAPAQVMMQCIANLPDDCETAIVIGHNPGISELAGYTGADVVTMVTAQVVGLEVHVEQWSHLSAGTGDIVYFDYPKQHLTS